MNINDIYQQFIVAFSSFLYAFRFDTFDVIFRIVFESKELFMVVAFGIVVLTRNSHEIVRCMRCTWKWLLFLIFVATISLLSFDKNVQFLYFNF